MRALVRFVVGWLCGRDTGMVYETEDGQVFRVCMEPGWLTWLHRAWAWLR